MFIFLFVGTAAIVVGLLSIFSDRFDLFMHRLFPDSRVEEKLLSPESRYWIRRYISGVKGIIGGILAILLYLASDVNVYDKVSGWVHAILR
jgi:hypothetical protein